MRMMHPQHGFHIPQNNVEQAEMIKAGWTECTEEMWREMIEAKRFKDYVADSAAEVATLAPVKRGPGRPPKD